ncbi:MAG: right-handed parallel beta-helix repeat-containing protein [Anaerolineae bacterium]|nr:right-handed parallel beta-helix repeat-containing protein [Anaerolineae bacterium]
MSRFRFFRYLVIFAFALAIFTIPAISKAQGTTFTVSNTNDSGAGSLRQAILDANSTVGKDTINFSLAGTLPTISLLSPLPSLTDSAGTIIDALPSGGSVCAAQVIISGTSASASYGLRLEGGGNTLLGLNIQGFQQAGIYITSTSSANLMYCNTIEKNGAVGLRIEGANNLIGDNSPTIRSNIFKNNPSYNVLITGAAAQGNILQQNKIGDSPTAIGAQNAIGVQIEAGATGNSIGSNGDHIDDWTEGNYIGGNSTAGVIVTGTGTNNNIVASNIVGRLSNSTTEPNGIGILVRSGAQNNIIGSDDEYELPNSNGNMVVASAGYGIKLTDSSTNGNRVAGNYVGMLADRTIPGPFANAGGGIEITNGAQNNLVGSDRDNVGDTGEGNVIVNNGGPGIHISGATTSGNKLVNNYIGQDWVSNPKPNLKAIYIEAPDATLNTLIQLNIIGSATEEAVLINSAHGNTIIGNALMNVVPNHVNFELLKLVDSHDNVIGGTIGTATNIFSGTSYGALGCVGYTSLLITGAGSHHNTVQGNLFGAYSNGARLSCGEVPPITITNASDNLIGGTVANAGNKIAYFGTGIVVNGTSINNRILGNSIYEVGGGIPIDLNNDGATANDPDDLDAGANGTQNTVEWDSTSHTLTSEFSVQVFAHLDSTPNTTFRVEFFLSTSCYNSTPAYSVTEQFISAIDATTDANGIAAISTELVDAPLASKPYLAATVTGPTGTSEASSCIYLNRTLVLNTNDGGVGSFRTAINVTNNLPHANIIEFAIPGTGVKEIVLNNELPRLSALHLNRVEIHGLTQTGATCDAPKIVIRRNPASDPQMNGLTVTGSYQIEGLVIVGFNQTYGIKLQTGGGNIVSCNFIGVEADGVTAAPNKVGLISQGSSNQILDNLISGNLNQGIFLDTAVDTNLSGNYVGIDNSGTAALPNGGDGVFITGTNVRIQEDNVISGNKGNGVVYSGASGDGLMYGTIVGLNAAGTAAIPNDGDGVVVQGYRIAIGGNNIVNTDLNVISGNKGNGIRVESSLNVIDGNFVGLNAAGTAAIGNQLNGILVTGNQNQIGDLLQDYNYNWISGNLQDGIVLDGVENLVTGAAIGTNAMGTGALGNGGNGVRVNNNDAVIWYSVISNNGQSGIADYGATSLITENIVGTDVSKTISMPNAVGMTFNTPVHPISGSTEVWNNVITHNTGAGIRIPTTLPTYWRLNVHIFDNNIYSNGGLGIDLEGEGVTPNDPMDQDDGSNLGQNYPVILTAEKRGSTLSVRGTLSGQPGGSFTIRLYYSATCDPSGYGEGEAPIANGTAYIGMYPNGENSFAIDVAAPPGLPYITATAEDLIGNTSEFSNCKLVAAQAPDTIGIYRPSTNMFYLRNSNSTGFSDINVSLVSLGMDPVTFRDVPVVGDWNGDGIDTVGFYRRGRVSDNAGAGLFVLSDSNSSPQADHVFVLGNPSDTPLVGDWDGDGRDSVGVFRPTNGLIYIKNNLTTGFADYTMVLGNPGDVGIAGDWNNDGKDSPGVYRPGAAPQFYLTNQVCNCIVASDYNVTFGNPGDQPFTGDWNGDGHWDSFIYRTSNGITYLRNDPTTTGFSDFNFVYGINGDYAFGGVWQAAVPPSSEPTPQIEVAPTFQPKP